MVNPRDITGERKKKKKKEKKKKNGEPTHIAGEYRRRRSKLILLFLKDNRHNTCSFLCRYNNISKLTKVFSNVIFFFSVRLISHGNKSKTTFRLKIQKYVEYCKWKHRDR